jgi:hypothetical protein
MNCHSELDESQLVDAEGIAHYHMMTGSVNWAIALGRHDIQHAVSTLLSAAPCNNNNHVVAPPYHHEGNHIVAAVVTSIVEYSFKSNFSIDFTTMTPSAWEEQHVGLLAPVDQHSHADWRSIAYDFFFIAWCNWHALRSAIRQWGCSSWKR